MPTIHFEPDARDVDSDDDATILETALRAGLPHMHVCGGRARCSTCRVLVQDGLAHCSPPTEPERVLCERLHFEPQIRLACQTRVTGPVRLRRLVLDELDVALASENNGKAVQCAAGSEQAVAVMFSDIRGFTSMVEALLPYDVIHLLNRYFALTGAVVRSHGGYVDNYIGDGLLAVFNQSSPIQACCQAVSAGLQMLQAVERFSPYVQSVYGRELRIGIGIHFGTVVVGTVGVAQGNQRETVIGDTVNFASRIEEANKDQRTSLLISEKVQEILGERIELGASHQLRIRGKRGTHALYEVLGLTGGCALADAASQA